MILRVVVKQTSLLRAPLNTIVLFCSVGLCPDNARVPVATGAEPETVIDGAADANTTLVAPGNTK